MIAEELINHLIPSLKLSDKAEKAIVWMEELRTNQLPVIDNGSFKGLISEEVIFENNDINKSVAEYALFAADCYVYDYQHFFDVIKQSNDHKVEIVAVLDELNHYLGVIALSDTLSALAQTAAIQSTGGLIVLSMNQNDYSLSEISRLVESNEAKILSSFVTPDNMDPHKIKVTIKINKSDLSHIVATLERFNYKVIAKFQHPSIITNEKDRLDILLRYLNI
ncbi:MAG: CBS domain-containing protein [Candidatus Cyclobacteriaceae bacterium M3_2C_046]